MAGVREVERRGVLPPGAQVQLTPDRVLRRAAAGLAVVLPWLGYATWHLYTRLIDRSAITPRRD